MEKYRRVYSEHGGNHIVIANRIDHSRFRNGVSYGFSEVSLRGRESLLLTYVNLLLQRLEQASNGGETELDMCKWYNWTTFDIIGHLTFGEPFGCLESTTLHPWVNTILTNFKLSAYRQALSYLLFRQRGSLIAFVQGIDT